MSHEIRTPMNGVVGLSHLLLDTELDAQQKQYVTGISTSADNLLTVINDILDLSRVEAGKIVLEAIPLDLRVVVDEAASIVAAPAREKQLEVVVDFPARIPRLLIGDAGRIRQVLLNLANNAVKFTERGHVRITVETFKMTGFRLS